MQAPEHKATLAAAKEELLTLLLAEAGLDVSPADTISPRRTAEDVVLSFAQQRLWFLHQLEPTSPSYNVPNAVRLTGPLNVAALQQSLSEMVRRHEVLRMVFPTIAGRPLPVVLSATPMPLPLVNLQAFPEPERTQRAARWTTWEARQPFDLAHGPLVRGTLLWLESRGHVLLLTMHHIVSDAWSRGILLRELAALYEAFADGQPSSLPELSIQYADFAYWQRQWLRNERLQRQMDYWKQQLGGSLPVLELPTDRPRPALQTFQGARQAFAIPRNLTAALRLLGQQEGSTLFMVLLAAFQTLLYRYTGQNDISVGTPVANRTRLETEGLIGFFVNTLVLRTDLAGNPPFRVLLQRVREVTLAAHTHQDVPFELLVDELQPVRDADHTPLFQIIFGLQNAPQDTVTFADLTLSPQRVDSGTAKFDLTLTLTEEADGLSGLLEYRTDLFDAATVTRWLGHFMTILEGIVANPDQTLAALPLLTAAERQQLLCASNNTPTETPVQGCIHELFERQVERTPDAVAVVFGQEHLTYRELNQRANQVAHHLRGQGVGPEVLVGICVERSLALLMGVLGILKAGGAYVPLDPAYPRERLGCILEDAQVSVLVTQQCLHGRLPEHTAPRLCLDTDWPTIARQSVHNPRSGVVTHHLAYVIYTSGSTGRPKGVAIAHRNAVALLVWAGDVFAPAQRAAVLASTSLCFDLSVFELFVPLSWGGTIILADTLLQLPCVPAAQHVTLLNTVPSVLTALLKIAPLPASVRTVNLAGEPLHTSLVKQVYAHAGVQRVFDLYGPSEDTTYSTFALRAPAGPATIGRPIANKQTYLLAPHQQPVPVGVPGEIYLAGGGLARGYLNRPALTAEKFIPNLFGNEPGARLYRTGDVARYLPDGNIEFLGRIDQQVKIRGFRIEPGEIEAILGQHPAVRETVVLARQDGPGEKRLVAYIVPAQQTVPAPGVWRNFLQHRLPDYMVPATFVVLDALPLTANGKVDRRALPAPDPVRPALESAFTAPRTSVEETLASIWREILRVEHVGVHDNFFELGGDSILSIQIIARANQVGLRLTPRQIFQHQTIAELAAVADLAPTTSTSQEPVTGPLPLTPIQHWFFAQDLVDVHHFNQAVLLQVRYAMLPTLIEQAMQQVLWHHDALRLRYRHTEDGWSQEIIGADAAVPFCHIDISTLAETAQVQAIEAIAADLQASLHLERGPLLRVAYFTLGEGQPGRLLLIIHHLAVDGVSWRILLTDLQQICEHLHRGEPVQLPPKTTSFKAWAERLRTHAQSVELQQELDYWRAIHDASVYRLPVDDTGRPNTLTSARCMQVSLTPAETRALLQEVPQTYQTRINDVLLTALAQTLNRWSDARTLLLDVEGHGREGLFDDIDLSRTVGWFTSIFPVLLELDPTAMPGPALLAVKEQLRRLPSHGIGYSVLRYLSQEAEIRQTLRTLPRPEVRFNYLGQFDQVLPAHSWFTLAREASGPSQSQRGMRPYLLEISGSVVRHRLQMQWTYSEHVHHQNTVEALAQRFLEALRTLITHCQSTTAGGYTPGDFPLVQLGQAELEQAFGEIAFEGEEA